MPISSQSQQIINHLQELLNQDGALTKDGVSLVQGLINSVNDGTATDSSISSANTQFLLNSNQYTNGNVTNPAAQSSPPVDDVPDTPKNNSGTGSSSSTPTGTNANPIPTDAPSQNSTGDQSTGASSGSYDSTAQATSDSSGNPTSSYSTTSYNTPSVCGNSQILDKRIKLLRTHDKVLWFFWVDFVVGSGSNTNNATNPLQFNIIDPISKNSVKTDPLQEEDSVLFYTKTLNECFNNLPSDSQGTITKNVMWCVWYDKSSNLYKPIKGAKYFTMWYDNDSHELDLAFWANVDIDYIGVKGIDIYDKIKQPITSFGDIDPKAQRVIFYTKGKYTQVMTNRTITGTEVQLTGMFIFSKPRLLIVPGQKQGSSADCVIDEAVGLRFLEFSG